MKFFKLNSIRIKMGVFSAVILGSILILYSLYHYYQLRDALYGNLDSELHVKAHELGKTIKAFQKTKSPGGDIHYAALKVLSFDVDKNQDQLGRLADRQWLRLVDRYNLPDDYVSILSINGQELASSDNVSPELRAQFKELFEKHRRIRSTQYNIICGQTKLRVLQMMMFARDEPHYLIQIATPMTVVDEILQKRLWGVIASIPIVMLLFSLSGFLLANQILRPVRTITKTAESLTHKDLSQRVAIDRLNTEMFFLADAFNKMIGRLEMSFKHITSISSHIAHELKTPLTIIKGEGQTVIAQQKQSLDSYRAVIQSNIIETERMLKVIDDLLLITNISYNKKIFHFEPVQLKTFLRDICQKSQILSEPKNIQINFSAAEDDIVILGDHVHLRRFFFNLIDNAIKFSYPGGVIHIVVARRKDEAVISVKDQGKGIAPHELPYIFNHPFEKKPNQAGRQQGTPAGAGIGLFLCRAIAQAHQGTVTVTSEYNAGSLFSLILPCMTAHERTLSSC